MQAERPGGAGALAAVPLQDGFQQRRFDQAQQVVVQLALVGGLGELLLGPLADEFRETVFQRTVGRRGRGPDGRRGRGQVLRLDAAAAGHDHGVLDGIPQLAHVPVPRATLQFAQGVCREPGRWLAGLGGRGQEVRGQLADVAARVVQSFSYCAFALAVFNAAAYRPVVVAYRDGSPVRLEELGEVIDSVENTRTAGWYNNTRAIVLSIQRQPGTNTIEVVDTVRKFLPAFREQMPSPAKESGDTLTIPIRRVRFPQSNRVLRTCRSSAQVHSFR